MKRARPPWSLLFGCLALIAGCSAESIAIPESQVELEVSARAGGTPTVEVLEPTNGAVLASPFTVRVRTENVALAPAGRTLDGQAHWHVMTNGECLAAGQVIPKDDVHLHVGSGEEFAEFDLSPGTHDLCVQLGDGFHVAVAVTDIVTITVADE